MLRTLIMHNGAWYQWWPLGLRWYIAWSKTQSFSINLNNQPAWVDCGNVTLNLIDNHLVVTSQCPCSAAKWTALNLLLSNMLTFAPRLRMALTSTAAPALTASIRAVRPVTCKHEETLITHLLSECIWPKLQLAGIRQIHAVRAIAQHCITCNVSQ